MTHLEHLTPETFLELSADISYRLSGRAFDPRMLLDLILEGAVKAPCDENILIQAISVVHAGYGDSRRKMGPLAVVHPLRVAALLSRVTHDPSTLDLLGAILHDRDEDLTEGQLEPDNWTKMQREMANLTRLLDSQQQWFLGERISLLTHHKETMHYCQYLAELLTHSSEMPDLIRVKLADRLDNTLDIGVSSHGLPESGLFGTLFDLLFLPNFNGFPTPASYIPISEPEGTQILANIFKNAEFLSLLRSEQVQLEGTTRKLYQALVRASIRITKYLVQDTFLDLPVIEQRAAVADVQFYCQAGGLQEVRGSEGHPLDGLFLGIYGCEDGRKGRLRELLTGDKTRLARVALVFLAVFANFLADPSYTIKGIDRHGTHLM